MSKSDRIAKSKIKERERTIFTLYPKYADFTPGPEHKKSELPMKMLSPEFSSDGGVACGCLSMVVFLITAIGIILCTVSALQYQRDRPAQQRATALITQCTVVKEPIPRKMSATQYYRYHLQVAYTYTVGKRSYKNEERRDGSSCEAFPQGSETDILYYEPARASLERGYESMDVTPFGAMALFSLTGLLILTILEGLRELRRYLYSRRYHEFIVTQGTVIEGTITRIKGYKKRVGRRGEVHFYVRVTYEFETPRKRLLKRTVRVHRQDLNSVRIPPVGTPVRVLYAHEYAYTIL